MMRDESNEVQSLVSLQGTVLREKEKEDPTVVPMPRISTFHGMSLQRNLDVLAIVAL